MKQRSEQEKGEQLLRQELITKRPTNFGSLDAPKARKQKAVELCRLALIDDALSKKLQEAGQESPGYDFLVSTAANILRREVVHRGVGAVIHVRNGVLQSAVNDPASLFEQVESRKSGVRGGKMVDKKSASAKPTIRTSQDVARQIAEIPLERRVEWKEVQEALPGAKLFEVHCEPYQVNFDSSHSFTSRANVVITAHGPSVKEGAVVDVTYDIAAVVAGHLSSTGQVTIDKVAFGS